MFDVSFSELVLILIVGLLVFGPEKLPEVVRTTGLWLGKLRRSFAQIRAEIEREVGVDEIKREIHNQSILDSLKDVRDDLRRTQSDLQNLPYDVADVVERNSPAAREHVIPDDDFRHNDTAPIDDGPAQPSSPAVANPDPSTVRPS